MLLELFQQRQQKKLLTSGYDLSPSHGISLSEHYHADGVKYYTFLTVKPVLLATLQKGYV